MVEKDRATGILGNPYLYSFGCRCAFRGKRCCSGLMLADFRGPERICTEERR